jgi:alpha-mannosidase
LPYDTSVATLTNRPAQGCFDCSFDTPEEAQGNALPAEMLPESVDFSGIQFHLAPATGKADAVTARSQILDLPSGHFNRVYLLAASAHGDQDAKFLVDDKPVSLKIQEWTGNIGQWDYRTWETHLQPVPQRPGSPAPRPGMPPRMREVTEFTGTLIPGFIKRADVAWFSSHRHDPGAANDPYAYSYLYAYALDIPTGARKLTLPSNTEIRIMAVTAVGEAEEVHPSQPLYDMLGSE